LEGSSRASGSPVSLCFVRESLALEVADAMFSTDRDCLFDTLGCDEKGWRALKAFCEGSGSYVAYFVPFVEFYHQWSALSMESHTR
jgi:hypothetical protein